MPLIDPHPLMRRLPGVLSAVAIASAAMISGTAQAEAPTSPTDPSPKSSGLLTDLLERADRAALHEDPQWLALLHYEREWLPPRMRSHAITRSFFLSEQGDRNSYAELQATLQRFFDPVHAGYENEHPQCLFIARRHWLRQRLELGTDELPRVSCPGFEQWRAGLDAQGLSLIFPEEFMNNPASIFGHTLLRIDVTREGGPEEILGHAVDFTANTGDDGGITYLAKGVLGFYPAFFGLRPYYQQLKRYADWENRDIWEYRLDVDDDQMDLLLMHLWELREVEFPYYFFTKNCSYELLRLLEVGIPDLHASERFRGPVIPVATVRAIVGHPGFVTRTRYRASPATKLRADLRSLSGPDRSRVRAIVEGHIDPASEELEDLPPARRARILDVAYDQLRYEYLSGQVTDEESRALSRQILLARSRLGTLSPSQDAATHEPDAPAVRPDQGHESLLLGLSAGWRDDEAFIDLRLRPAFHDLMDNGGGYPDFMQVRLLDTRVRIYPESGQVRLQELTVFEAASLSPRSRVFRPWAWSTGTGLQTRRLPDGEDLEDASVWRTHIGGGLAWDPYPGVLLYGLADVRLDVGPDLEDNVSLGPGARLGLFAGGADARWRGHLFGEVTRFAVGDTTTWVRGGAAARFSTSRNTALTLEGSVNRIYGESWLEGALRLSLHF